jgi:SAM-dependent methyltransferase
MTELAHSKIIDIADFSDPVLLPYLHDIAYGEMRRFGLTEPVIIPDSKQWECAMMLRTLTEFGVLRPGALLVGIGAGTEETTFALASKGCIVFPTDRYLEQTPWSDVAPAGMMVRPSQYSQFDDSRGAVIPMHTDARALSLPDNFFDGAYSAGSIEHFGSLEAVAAAAEEIGRVLKPGGIAVLSTEFRLEGPNDQRWFSDDCILFTPSLLQEHIIGPSGLELIGEPNFTTSQQTFDSRVVLVDFLEKAKRVETLTDKRNAYPNLVLFHTGYLFCSVHLAMRKPLSGIAVKGTRSAGFQDQIKADATRASGILTAQIAEWTRAYGTRPGAEDGGGQSLVQAQARIAELDAAWHWQDRRARAAESALARLEQSRSIRFTRPLREAVRVARATPMVREIGVFTLRALRKLKRMLH